MSDATLRDLERRARAGDEGARAAWLAATERAGRPLVFIDLETRSRCDLRTFGGRRYAADPSTELLCGVAVIVDERANTADVYAWAPWPGPVGEWSGAWPAKATVPGESRVMPAVTFHEFLPDSDDPPPAIADALARGAPLIAQNAHGFDRHVWTSLGLPVGTAGWLDALDRVRRRGLPGALDALGQRLYGAGKDQGGKRLMMKHSLPQKARGGQPDGRFIDPAGPALTSIVRYCARDCLLLAAVWLDEDLGAEHVDDDVLAVHERIDDRGVPIDLALAGRIAAYEARQARESEERAASHGVTPTVLRSSPALRAWLRRQGVDVPDVTAGTVENILADLASVPDVNGSRQAVRDVCEARLSVARVTGGKLIALAARTDPRDGRYRGWGAYYGAHTGRWAGRGVQVHNFPRPNGDLDAEAAIADLRQLPWFAGSLGITVADVIGSLLRSVICAPDGRYLARLDWSAIEARGLLWLAEDEEGLDVYRDYDAQRGPDPYIVQAADLFGVPAETIGKADPRRQAGKVAVLACGYQGGAGAVERFAAKSRVDLAAAGIDASGVVEGWRDSRPRVAGRRTGKTLERDDGRVTVLRRGGLWKALNRAARLAVDAGETTTAGRCEFRREGAHLIVELPSGRPLVYRDARIEPIVNRASGKVRMAVAYQSPRGYRVALYGGLLAENVTQAVCRDVLAENLVRFERAGFPVVLHVHDEIVCEVTDPRALDEMRAMASEAPPWAPGFPLATSGAAERRWGK